MGYSYEGQKFYFIDFDDTILLFQNLAKKSKHRWPGIWHEPTLGFLKRVHSQWGTVFLMPCFYRSSDGRFNLSMFPDSFKHEFEACSDWLKFSFHSWGTDWNYPMPDVRDRNNPYHLRNMLQDYSIVRNEIIRICGTTSWCDEVQVTHWISGSKSALTQLSRRFGARIWGTFAPSNYEECGSLNYYFHHNQEHWESMKNNDVDYDKDNDCWFFLEDFLIEDQLDKNGESWAESWPKAPEGSLKMMLVLSHEYQLNRPEVKQFVLDVAEWAAGNGYVSRLPTYADLSGAYLQNGEFFREGGE